MSRAAPIKGVFDILPELNQTATVPPGTVGQHLGEAEAAAAAHSSKGPVAVGDAAAGLFRIQSPRLDRHKD